MNRPTFLALALSLPAVLSAQNTGSATYEVLFTATWSAATHPGAYPNNAHFSPLVGGTHASSVSFWAPGGIATTGIEVMAESGSTLALRNEINAAIASGDADELLLGSGIDSPGATTDTFTLTSSYPLVTLVTMIAPSPDWFLGVHDLSLLENGRFVDQLTVPLLAYDAGTDSGPNFTSGNQNTLPHEPIGLVTGGPFTGIDPLGTFTFRRVDSHQSYGCGVNPVGSLAVASGEPRIGQTVNYEFRDPTGAMGLPALTLLFISRDPAPGFPCGTSLPQFGLAGAGVASELLVAFPTLSVETGPMLTGSVASLALSIPMNTALIGQDFYLQGALADGARFGLTDGIELVIGE